MKKICLATNNRGKAIELRELLGENFEIVTLEDIGCIEEIEETGNSFQENSFIKANHVYQNYGVDCIADDSGLEVEFLGGAPGIYSARYGGEHGDHEKNMAKLLKELDGVTNRSAGFQTVITYIENGEVCYFEGEVKGEIILSKQGSGGFGYDPIFIPAGFNRTFAEMGSDEKNPISHRGKAIQKLLAYLKMKE